MLLCNVVEIALLMEAVSNSETSVSFYNTGITQSYIPEDSHLHTHRRENLKYNILFYASFSLPCALHAHPIPT